MMGGMVLVQNRPAESFFAAGEAKPSLGSSTGSSEAERLRESREATASERATIHGFMFFWMMSSLMAFSCWHVAPPRAADRIGMS